MIFSSTLLSIHARKAQRQEQWGPDEAIRNRYRSVARGDANLVLRNVLYALHQNGAKWVTFSSALDKVFPGVTIEISFDQNQDEFIEAWVVKNGERLPIDGAGTGLLQTAQILSYIYLFEPTTTLLDEPDSHLHPSNQRSLSELLIDLSNAGTTQFLIATHSRHILDTLKESANIIWMRQGQVEKSTVHLDLLIDLGALDKAEGLITQGIKYVVLTEDEDTRLIKALLSFLDMKAVQVWSYKGCSNVLTAEAIANFVKSVSPGTEVVVHRDSDYLSSADKARISAPFIRLKVKNFFTSGIDLESYFCDVDHLKLLNVGYESQVETAVNSALIIVENAMQEKAREGIKKVEHHRGVDGAPTVGKVVAKAWADGIDVKLPRWRHGKILLKEIRKQFLSITGKDIVATTYSTQLKIDDLKKLFT